MSCEYALSYHGRHFRSLLVMMKKGLDKFERDLMWNMYYNVIVLIDGHKWKRKLSESFLGTAEDFVFIYVSAV